MVKPDLAPSSTASMRKQFKFSSSTQSLQERLHTLLTRLSESIDIIQTWPESQSGDDSKKVHNETTAKLISSICKIIEGIQIVEEKVNVNLGGEKSLNEEDMALAEKLRQAAVPMDLLDMMDNGNGLNPDCFARGLLKEAMRQMKNLQKRKRLLKMLAMSVQNGVDQKMSTVKISSSSSGSTIQHSTEGKKRKRDLDDNQEKGQPTKRK